MTATDQAITSIDQHVTAAAQALKDSLNLKVTHMEARLMVLEELSFVSEYQFTCFKKRIQESAVKAWEITEVKDCLSRTPDQLETYYAFSGELGLIDIGGEEKMKDHSIMVKSFRTLRSHWTGFADKEKSIENRVASPANPEIIMDMGRVLKIPTLTIESKMELSIWFMRFGGNALVPKKLVEADSYLSRWLSPYPNVPGWEG